MATALKTNLDMEDLINLGNAARLLTSGKQDQVDLQASAGAAEGVLSYGLHVTLSKRGGKLSAGVKCDPDDCDLNDCDLDDCCKEIEKACGCPIDGKTPVSAVPKGASPATMQGLDWGKILQGALKVLVLLAQLSA